MESHNSKTKSTARKVRWLGVFGVRGLESIMVDQKMLCADAEYRFERGKIYNLESSNYINQCESVSGAHNDIAKREVAHAVGATLAAA